MGPRDGPVKVLVFFLGVDLKFFKITLNPLGAFAFWGRWQRRIKVLKLGRETDCIEKGLPLGWGS